MIFFYCSFLTGIFGRVHRPFLVLFGCFFSFSYPQTNFYFFLHFFFYFKKLRFFLFFSHIYNNSVVTFYTALLYTNTTLLFLFRCFPQFVERNVIDPFYLWTLFSSLFYYFYYIHENVKHRKIMIMFKVLLVLDSRVLCAFFKQQQVLK